VLIAPTWSAVPALSKISLFAFLLHREHDWVGLAVADVGDLHVGALAPRAVGHLGELGEVRPPRRCR